MGAVATILPWVVEGMKLVPSLVSGGKALYDGVKSIWEGVTSDEPATPEQQAEYDTAEQIAFEALMRSTDDVKDD